jgi:hypothetical protein
VGQFGSKSKTGRRIASLHFRSWGTFTYAGPAPADALRVALMMLARCGRLESGDVLKVLAASSTGARRRTRIDNAPGLV